MDPSLLSGVSWNEALVSCDDPKLVHSVFPEAKQQGVVCIMFWFALLGGVAASVHQEK